MWRSPIGGAAALLALAPVLTSLPASAGPPAGDWVWPFGASDGFGYPVTRAFAHERKGRFHTGVDIAAPCGTPAWSIGRGTVVSVERGDRAAQVGKHVVVRYRVPGYDRPVFVMYAHLQRLLRTKGEVHARTPIARTGRSGRASDCHLHLAARVGSPPDGGYSRAHPKTRGYLDPAALLRRLVPRRR